MNDIIHDEVSQAVNILVALFMIVLILYGGLLVVLAWLLIKSGIDWIDHLTLLQEAQAIFNQVRAEELPDLQIDPLLRAIFGDDGGLPKSDAPNTDDWLTRAIFESV